MQKCVDTHLTINTTTTQNMNKILLTTIISLVTFSAFGQGFYAMQEDFKLLTSGKKKVLVFKGIALDHFKTIDSASRVIIKNSVQPSKFVANDYAPKYNDSLSISYSKTSFYNAKGTIDSTIVVGYSPPLLTSDGECILNQVDSTLFVYGHTLLGEKILTRNRYYIKNGNRTLRRTDHYGYDPNDRLTMLIEGDGRTQFNYEYNEDGKISAYYVHGAKVNFEYDESGRKSKDIYETSTYTYEYDSNSLLIKEIRTGKGEDVFTYYYE